MEDILSALPPALEVLAQVGLFLFIMIAGAGRAHRYYRGRGKAPLSESASTQADNFKLSLGPPPAKYVTEDTCLVKHQAADRELRSIGIKLDRVEATLQKATSKIERIIGRLEGPSSPM